MDKIDELLQAGQKFNFSNNSYSVSHGTYTRASDELLGWAATVEDFIRNTYGEESAAFKLY
ncbi:MAG: nucleotide-binding protein, partial [Bacteroidales bacterium]|nr:nucleotide-binding protein [Bacteroidales bacterium]